MTSPDEEESTNDKEIIIDDLDNGTIVITESSVIDAPTSAAKLLRGLYMSGTDIQVLVLGLYRSPEFIRVEPLKPPLEDFIFRHVLTSYLQSLTVHRCNCDRQLRRHRNVGVASVQSSSIGWLSGRNIRRYSYILDHWNHRRYRFYLLSIQMILLINAWSDLPCNTVAEASRNRKHGVFINLTESETEQTHRIVGHASVERVAIDWMWRNIFLLYSVAHDRRSHPEAFWLKALH